MKPETLWWIGRFLFLLAAVAAWCAVIYVALEVSTIVLNTLHQIVELAQMS